MIRFKKHLVSIPGHSGELWIQINENEYNLFLIRTKVIGHASGSAVMQEMVSAGAGSLLDPHRAMPNPTQKKIQMECSHYHQLIIFHI